MVRRLLLGTDGSVVRAGAMSLAWMAIIAVLIAVEKLLPWRTGATVGVAIVLVGLAIGVAAAPDQVPASPSPRTGTWQ